MIAADSSIWELHWNGQQKQYTYTSVTAAKGLCEAAGLAISLTDSQNATAWNNAVQRITSGIKDTVVTNNFLAQSVEELRDNSGYVDASVIEAFRWGLFDPAGIIAKTTIQGLLDELTVPNGIGIARNDDGGAYDSAEWVFMDLRLAGALRNSGVPADKDKADLLIDWITAQAINNMGLISELHTREGSKYDGSPPMVGFGAGAYIIELWHRENGAAPTAPCRIRW
jgi:GH15 family glucan-1,4-alpha-glucosidase